MFILELEFTPDDDERLAARPAHRDQLTALHAAGKVVHAGPFADESGALILLDVDDRQAADAVVSGDPYYTLPGVRVVRLQEWSPLPL